MAKIKETSKVQSEENQISFAVVEAYKTIRTNLMFINSQTENKCVTISSAVQTEGKSTTSVNVAIAFSQLGSKVLLIDADLRKPSVHKKLRISNKVGLSTVLGGFCELDEAIVSVNDSLHVLPSGAIPPNPSEMLSSNKMNELVKAVSEKYDFVFFDTPPLTVVSDALVVAPKTSGIVLVVRDAVTTYDEFEKALAAIELANVRLLGAVLNGSGEDVGKKYNKYYRKYSLDNNE